MCKLNNEVAQLPEIEDNESTYSMELEGVITERERVIAYYLQNRYVSR